MMKIASITVAGLLFCVVSIQFLWNDSPYETLIQWFCLLSSLLVFARTVVREKSPETAPKTPPPAPASPPPTMPEREDGADAEVVGLLAALQEKGRLIDFLMDDIAHYEDAQVGAAARVVHEGCLSVLKECFEIIPIRSEEEGGAVTVPPGYAVDEYRLIGKISGDPPFSGILVHKGWKATHANLPRIIKPSGDRLPTLAPAEVELK